MKEQPSSNQMLDPSLLMDNAACASQCAELLDDHPTRQAVLLNVYRPLWDEIERLRTAIEAVLAEDPGVAQHEQAARWEWARKHLAEALSPKRHADESVSETTEEKP